MGLVIHQRVAVRHHPGTGVVASDRQRITQKSRGCLRESGRHAARNNVDTADTQGLQPIRCRHGEGAGLGQRRSIRAATVAQVPLVKRQFPTSIVEPRQRYRIIQVLDIQHQIRRTGIAISIRQRVGKGFSPRTPTMQVEEVRIRWIQGVGVGTICRQYQGAVGSGEGPGSDWSGDPVSPLNIIGQYIPGQHRGRFGSHRRVGIRHRRRHIVDDHHIQVDAVGAAIGIGRHHGEAFTQAVGAASRRMAFVAEQGVAIGDDTGSRVITGDGEGVAQRRYHGLRRGIRNATADQVDPADAQALQSVRRTDGKAAALGQGRSVRAAASGKVLLEDRDDPAIGPHTAEIDRVIEVADVQHQVGSAGVAIRIGQGVGERLGALAAAMQIDEVRVRRIQGIGVGTIRG